MSELFEFTHPYGPTDSKVQALAVTTSSVYKDLTTANYTNIYNQITAGRMMTLKADGGDIYYRWTSASAGTVDDTAADGTTVANQCQILFSGERSDERPPPGTVGIIVKGSIACKLRIHPSSKPLDEIIRGV